MAIGAWLGSVSISYLQAVIFDLDGTLIDSTGTYCRMVQEALLRLALPVPATEGILAAVQSGEFHWARVIPEQEHHRLRELVAAAQSTLAEIGPHWFREHVRLFEAVPELLQTLREAPVALGIASSTPAALMPMKLAPLREAGWLQHFQAIISTDDVSARKPAPDPLLECARRLTVPPYRCAYLGDTCEDIEAARQAGMTSLAVATGFHSRAQLDDAQPDLLLNDLNELIWHFSQNSRTNT